MLLDQLDLNPIKLRERDAQVQGNVIAAILQRHPDIFVNKEIPRPLIGPALNFPSEIIDDVAQLHNGFDACKHSSSTSYCSGSVAALLLRVGASL